MKRKSLLFAVPLMLVGLSPSVVAAPPDGSKISAEADWVIHLDFAAAVKSTIGKYILEHHEELDIDLDDLEKIEEELDIDLLEEILDVTLYGDDEEHMVALLRTTDAVDDALVRLQEHEESPVTKLKQGDAEIYSVDDGEVLFHVMSAGRDERLIVASNDAEVLGYGIRAAHGQGETLGEKLKVEPVEGALLYLNATSLPDDDDGDDPASMVLQKATGISGRIAEQGDAVLVEVRINTANSADASGIAQVVQGMIALGRLAIAEAGDDEEVQHFAEILDGINVESSDTSLNLSIRQSIEMALKALESGME